MSTPSDSTVKGKFDEVVGKAEQSLGETFGNQKLANEGAANEVKGHAEQAWGSVKEGVSDVKSQQQVDGAAKGHALRDEITSAAENAKEHIEAGIDRLTHKNNS